MKSIIRYINEDVKKHPLWCSVALSIFKGGKNITKESISNMILSMCNIEGRLKKFSDYLADEYASEYLAYQPSDDEFLKNETKNKITDQIAEFILKYIIEK